MSEMEKRQNRLVKIWLWLLECDNEKWCCYLPSKSMIRTMLMICGFLFLSGCGSVFGPGYSAHDQSYFKSVPYVVDTPEETALIWNYGSMGFYFAPRYQVKDGALYFSLQGTSSSGQMAGQESQLPIEEKNAREALRAGGAYWWNADGSITKLKVNP